MRILSLVVVCIANVFPDLKASIHVVFSTPLLHVTANSMSQRTESRPTCKIIRKITSRLHKCQQQLSAVQSELLQTVLNASACAVASLGGKLWLLSARSIVPSPAESLEGGQEFGLQNLGRLPDTSICFLYVS